MPKKNTFVKIFVCICVFLLSVGSALSQETSFFEKIVSIYEVKKDPGPTDWLSTQQESGQTFSDYVASKPILPSADKPYIYIVLLGDFSLEQQKILQMTSRYIEIYFQTPVKFSDPIPLAVVPLSARRTHPQTGDPQILTTEVIENILKPRMPKDAFCFIAFTSSDLWPGKGWNFVFGQASIEDRIGVWSIYRNGDLTKDFNLYLRRTIQTGTHEIAHLFGLHHCIYYECNLNGSNSRHESDLRPLWECPICLRKLAWGSKIDIRKRYRELSGISREFGFEKEAKFFEKNLKALQKK